MVELPATQRSESLDFPATSGKHVEGRLTGAIGLVLGWTKERSLSFVPAIVLHNLYNVAFAAASALHE